MFNNHFNGQSIVDVDEECVNLSAIIFSDVNFGYSIQVGCEIHIFTALRKSNIINCIIFAYL